MTSVAILKVLKMEVTPAIDELLVLKVLCNLDHFSVFHIFVVSMVTAAILEIPNPRCTSAHGDCHYGAVL